MPAADGSSSVQLLSASESLGLPTVEITTPLPQSAPSSSVKNCLPAIQQLTSITAQMEELLDSLAAGRNNGHASSREDARQNLPSTVTMSVTPMATDNGSVKTTDTGGCDDSNSSAMESQLCSRIRTHLVELRNNTDLLTWCLTAKKCSSGSDSGHDDSNNLPPEVPTGDVTDASVDADVPQQQSTDAPENGDEAAAQSSSATSQEADSFVEHVRSKARQVYCAIVRPFRTSAASNVADFTTEGNFTPL